MLWPTWLKKAGSALAVGVLLGVGFRVSEWLIPAPPVKLLLCDDSADTQCEVVTEEAGTDEPSPRPAKLESV